MNDVAQITLGIVFIAVLWSLPGFCFGKVVNNMARRKGYEGKFKWGFFFWFFAFLYWSFIPAAWDHPEYIKTK